jgi:uncharacterized protein (DUF58 family)
MLLVARESRKWGRIAGGIPDPQAPRPARRLTMLLSARRGPYNRGSHFPTRRDQVANSVIGRRPVRISREGIYYVFVLAFIVGGATLRDLNLLFLLAGLMLGPLLWNWRVVVLSLRQFRVRRHLPESIIAGRPFRVQLTAENGRRHLGSWLVRVDDTIRVVSTQPESTGGVRASVLIPYVAPDATSHASYEVTLPGRGAYEFGPLAASTRFPLGLVQGIRQGVARERVVVYPRIGQLLPGWLQQVDSQQLGREPVSCRQGPIDGDYFGLREWRSGDSRRWIHWRTTARLGKLAVRQFEQLQQQEFAIFLDLWQPAPSTVAQRSSVELAISLTATMLQEITARGGSRLTLGLAASPPGCWSAPASKNFNGQLLERLALAAATSADGTLPDLLANSVARLTSGTRVLIVSTRASQQDRLSSGEVFVDRFRHRRALDRVTWLDVNSPMMDSLFRWQQA